MEPQTLPDHRPPTPPPSLFARLGRTPTPATPAPTSPVLPAVEASAQRPVREAVPSAAPFAPAAPLAIAPEAFEPWAFEPPAQTGAPAAPGATAATVAPIQSDSDFWADSERPETHHDSDVVVDDNWASPGFATGGAAAVPEQHAYAFGADAHVPYEATPTPYDAGPGPSDVREPSVDWYEAAALEVVGTSTPADTSSTEFVGYDEPGEPEPAVEAVTETHPPAETEPAGQPAAEDLDAWASAAAASAAHDDVFVEDPWASQAFLDRIPETPDEPAAIGLAPIEVGTHPETEAEPETEPETAATADAPSTPTADAPSTPATEAPSTPAAEPATAIATTEHPDDAWPELATDAWPEATADGWPERGPASAWSAAAGTEAEPTEEHAPAADVEAASETESLESAAPPPTDAATMEHHVEPESWDAALAVLAPSNGKAADVEAASAPPEAAAVTPTADAHAAVKAETGPFSRYAAEAEVHPADLAASSAARSGDSDLWQLVTDPAASATEPAAGQKRSFDPVSVFLTVLVAIVIVVLLAGFLVFAQGVIH